MELSQKKLFLLDLDGTIYLEESLLPGAAEFLSLIHICWFSLCLQIIDRGLHGGEKFLPPGRDAQAAHFLQPRLHAAGGVIGQIADGAARFPGPG